MMKRLVSTTLVGATLVATTSLAAAGELHPIFDLSLRWSEGGVTLGGRVDGPTGPASGSVTGRLGRDGITIDGWFDERGRSWTFELDANTRDGFRAIVRPAPQRI
jgi:hypothetical protein